MHLNNDAYLAENLEKLGGHAMSRETEADIGAALLKFAVVTKELSALMKNLVSYYDLTCFLLVLYIAPVSVTPVETGGGGWETILGDFDEKHF